MRHPAETLKFFVTGSAYVVLGAICAGLAVSGPGGGYSAAALILGWVLIAIGVINFAVHAVATLMRDHERWRSPHFTEVIETVDGESGLGHSNG